jgi:signal transduction histidine kinase
MRSKRFIRSLRFKITVGIALPLVVILSAYSYLQYVRQRELLLTNLDQATTNLGSVIVASLQHAMLQQDLPAIQGILDNVGQEPGVRSVFVMNTSNEVRFAPQHQNVGARFTLAEPGCAACHAPSLTEHPSSIVFAAAGGEGVFRSCTPIRNLPACQRCHGAQNEFNGVLITDLSMQSANESLAADLRTNVLWASGAILATILAVNALMSRLVVTKLERLVQAIKQFASGDLSQRVRVQSGDEIEDLATSFNRMAEGLGEKAQLEAQVREHAQELERLYDELRRKEILRGQLLDKVITVQEEERKRIARGLHDDLGQLLTRLSINLKMCEAEIPPEFSETTQRLTATQTLVWQTIEQAHRLIIELRPTLLDELGLEAALREELAQRLAPLGVETTLTAEGALERLPAPAGIALFRIAQEAISNIALHAHAQHASVSLRRDPNELQLLIQDDGIGLPADWRTRTDGHRPLGLLGMQERAELLGGTLTIEPRPPGGTRLILRVPLETAAGSS